MLNLQTRIHLEKVKLACPIREQKLNRAGANVVHGPGDLDCGLTHTRAQLGVINWRRAFFNYLLMAALDGTLALTKMNTIAVLVGKDLNFNVSGLLNYFFEIHFRVAECRGSL